MLQKFPLTVLLIQRNITPVIASPEASLHKKHICTIRGIMLTDLKCFSQGTEKISEDIIVQKPFAVGMCPHVGC